MKKKIILLLVLCLLLITSCKKSPKENPIVKMKIKDYGTITIELYPKVAPNTVANFVNLIEDGFYDNNTFHRLVPKFVLQGGDPTASGTGGPGYTIKGEFELNGYQNHLSHTKGILSMARNNQSMDSAGSQFFIMLSDDYTATLDGSYAAFGKVTKGFEIIEKIENDDLEIEDEEMGILKEPLTIEKVTVDTKGYDYEVEKIKD